MFGVGAFGVAPAPTQALPLNMDQAALNHQAGPQAPQDPGQVWVTVYCRTSRREGVPREGGTEPV